MLSENLEQSLHRAMTCAADRGAELVTRVVKAPSGGKDIAFVRHKPLGRLSLEWWHGGLLYKLLTRRVAAAGAVLRGKAWG